MPSQIDVNHERAITPGCKHVLHFNNAGSSLPNQAVLDAQIAHLQLEAKIGGYEAEEANHAQIEHTYAAIARLLNVQPDEIAVIENATRAWDAAFYSIDFKPGDRILTAQAEYASNYIAFLQMAQQRGVQVDVVPSTTSGELDVDALERMITPGGRAKLIAMTHVPTNGGLVNPAIEVGRVARKHGVLYLLDACQSVGQMPLDVQAIGCDMLSATGRKYLRGPRGTGFLYVRRERITSLTPPMLDLHAATWTAADRFEIRNDARRFENWETNFAGKLALGVAVDHALALGLDAIWSRVQALAGQLRDGLSDIPGVLVQDIGRQQCGIVTFTLAAVEPDAIKRRMAAEHINVTTSSIFSTRIDMTARGLSKMVRASVHYYNLEEEVARFCAAIRTLAAA